MENEPISKDNRPEWLRELTDTSWNVELIVSGAAIFLASYLPEAVNALLRYYLENLVLDENVKKLMLPLLAFSFFKMVAWLLTATFVVHFILRAFWAGAVGLHAVYKEGIRYEQLPSHTDASRRQLKQEFGSLSDFILRIDRWANQVFSVAFLIALMGFGVGTLYMVIFFIMSVLPVFLGKETGRIVSAVALALLLALAMLPAVVLTLARKPEWAEKPLVKKLSAWTFRYAGQITTPFAHRPVSYLYMTFASNMPKARLYRTFTLLFVIIMVGLAFNFSAVLGPLAGNKGFTTRHFFAQGNNDFSFAGDPYDNLRDPDKRLPPVSIPSEVVEGPYLRVFVDYPKLLDEAMYGHCANPVVPDGLPRWKRQHLADSANLVCMTRFFQLSINDSLIAAPGWMFHDHPVAASPGVVAYLPTAGFKPGKNKLTVRVPTSQKPDSLRVYGALAFWYARE
jgi:hypothetical protein